MSGDIIPEIWHKSQGTEHRGRDNAFRLSDSKGQPNGDTEAIGYVDLELGLEICGLEIQNWESSTPNGDDH